MPKITDEPMAPFLERGYALLLRNRAAIAGLAVATVGLAALALVPRPRYEPLFVGLSDRDEAEIVRALSVGGEFDLRLERPGTLELPEGQIPAARMRLAQRNALPRGQRPFVARERLACAKARMLCGLEY